MQRRPLVPLFFVLVSASLLYAQTRPLSLCIVQTKSDRATQYEPSASSWAIATYYQLSGKRLRDGSPLAITVLPALVENDILPQVQRLQCAWVLEVWYIGNVGLPEPGPRGSPFSSDTIFFSLWNGETHKAIAQGAPLFRAAGHSPNRVSEVANVAAAVAQQVLSKLNKLHRSETSTLR